MEVLLLDVTSDALRWRNRRGAGGQSAPQRLFYRECFAYVSGKNRQRKKGKGVKIEKKRRKIVKGNMEN